MKKIIYSLSVLFLFAVAFTACDKDEDIVTFDESKIVAGTIAASATNITLDKANDDKEAVIFTLTPANFGFAAGINYRLQLSPKGANFKSPAEVVLGSVVSKKYTVKELNTLLINEGGVAGANNALEVRAIASIGDSLKESISNIITINVVPYFQLLDYPKVYVPGSYQGWAPDKAETVGSIDFSSEQYEGYINFPDATGTKFKFTPDKTWDNDWGDDGSKSGKLKAKGSDIEVTAAGYYYLKMNTTSLTYAVQKVAWGVIGDAQSGGWNTDQDMTYDATSKTWKIKVALEGGKKIKFRANDDWQVNFGDGTDDAPKPDGFLDYGGKDIAIGESGTYNIELNLSDPGNYVYTLKKQ